MSLRDKMLAVIDDVNGSVAEREELVEMIAIALLTRKNLFVLGEPGQAKSYAINLFRRHITGARQFERLLSIHVTTPPSAHRQRPQPWTLKRITKPVQATAMAMA